MRLGSRARRPSSNPADAWEQVGALEPWARFWYGWAAASFLNGYLSTAARGEFLPTAPEQLLLLLDVFQLEQAIYELRYELDNRPEWVRIALLGVRQLLGKQ